MESRPQASSQVPNHLANHHVSGIASVPKVLEGLSFILNRPEMVRRTVEHKTKTKWECLLVLSFGILLFFVLFFQREKDIGMSNLWACSHCLSRHCLSRHGFSFLGELKHQFINWHNTCLPSHLHVKEWIIWLNINSVVDFLKKHSNWLLPGAVLWECQSTSIKQPEQIYKYFF